MSVNDDLETAVESAIAANWSPTKMIEMMREVWASALIDKKNYDDRQFQKALK